MILGSVLGLPADDWAAIAACVTAAVAVIAAFVGLTQVFQARRLRIEQAAPYVVAYADFNAASEVFLDIVVKNLGKTAATDIRVAASPTLQRTDDEGAQDVPIPAEIPVLVPGQEYRVFWDSGITRHKSGLPDRHEVQVTFSDSRGKNDDKYTFVLDWAPFWSRDSITVYGSHDAAKALREIAKTVQRWSEGPGSRGIAATIRDGDAKDERRREWFEEKRRERDQD